MGLLEKLCPPSTHPLSVKLMETFDELKKELQVKTVSVNLNEGVKKNSAPSTLCRNF